MLKALKPFNSKQKNLFIFVRHSGCTFCRESLTLLKQNLGKIRAKGLMPIVVHMGSELSSKTMASDYELEDVKFVSDPERELYKEFGARKGSLVEVLGPKVVKRGVMSGAVMKYGIGKLEGDGFQLGGVYLFYENQMICLHRPENAADVENWDQILEKL